MFQQEGQTEKSLLHVYRLASEVDVLKRPDDYTEFAQLAIEAGSPGEAQSILEKALQKNVFTDARSLDKNKRLLESARKQAASDKAGLDKIASDAAAAKTGDKDVSVGLAYLGYKEYGKAVEALSRGLGKPGVQNEAEARLLLGIAELGAGHKDEAQKAFKAVKGDPKLERLANLWSLHARQGGLTPERSASAGASL
jgi:Tfp pilus assembly protein PilF